MNNKPLVSVIISTYNRYEQLLITIGSILHQTYDNFEIIIIDDYTNNDKYSNLKNVFKDINLIKIISLNEKNNSRAKLGFPSCGYVRNQGFKVAKGEYIAIIDDDDCMLPNRIETQINKMLELKEKGEECLGCCSEAYITDSNRINGLCNGLQLYNQEYYHDALSKKNGYDIKEFPNIITSKEIEKHNCIICSSTMFHRDVFNLIGYMPEVQNWKGTNGVYQDWEYWKKICKLNDERAKIYYIKEPLLIYYKKTL